MFSRPRASGIIAVALDPGDKLVGVAITDGTRDILLFTTAGKAIRFVEDEVRAMGREAAGVRGVKLSDEQRVNALIVAQDGFILTASQNGFGKLTPLEDFPRHGRGGQGVIALQITDRNGIMVGALQVSADDEIMLMSQNGVLVRTPVKDISIVGRKHAGSAFDSTRGGRSAFRVWSASRGWPAKTETLRPRIARSPGALPRMGLTQPTTHSGYARFQFLAGASRVAARGLGTSAR